MRMFATLQREGRNLYASALIMMVLLRSSFVL
jgi:hypothetical protein